MKAVMTEIPWYISEWRRRTGADRYDEVWTGVLHMPSSPNREHQELTFKLAMWLWQNWAEPSGSQVHQQLNVAEPGTWPNNYRIPDIVLLTAARFEIDRNEYLDGGPDAVIEVRSPGDESDEKFDFYAKIKVREVWIIDRDSKQPEIFELRGDEFQVKSPSAEGWMQSIVAGAEMRADDGKLAIQLIQQPKTLKRLP